MLVTCENVESLCRTLSRSISSVRNALHSRPIPEVLDRFWNIQDHLNRLVDLASVCSEVVFWSMEEDFPTLLDDVRDLLASASRGAVAHNTAAHACCRTINQLLTKLESYRLPSEAKALTASASFA